MKNSVFTAVAIAALANAAPCAAQSDSSMALGDCLAAKSTGADRVTLAGWIVTALSSAPKLKGVADVAPEKREEMDRALAKLFTRLITMDCAAEAKPMLKANNQAAFGASFEVLGRLAMQELTSDPAAASAMGKFTEYLNDADFAALRK